MVNIIPVLAVHEPTAPFLSLVLVSAPVIFGLLTVRPVLRFRRRAHGPFLRTARTMLGATVGLFVFYAMALYWLVVTGGIFDLFGRTLTAVHAPAYLLLSASAVGFGGIWYSTERHMRTVLHSEVRRHRQREERLRQRKAELETMLQGLSHDLKTPLLTLDWLTHDLLESLADGDPQATGQAAHRLQETLDGLRDLVEGLSDAQKPRTKRLNRELVDLGTVVNDVTISLRKEIEQQGAYVTLRDDAVRRLHTDPTRLRQVLGNLVGNALKYGRSQGGTITIDARVIEDTETSDGRRLLITVEDDGPGVAEQDMARIFGAFQRGEHGDAEGSGMGLAIVRRVARLLDGQAWAENRGEGGARFVIELPADAIVATDTTHDRRPPGAGPLATTD